MVRRRLTGVAGLAAIVSVAALVVAEITSTELGGPGSLIGLFVVFLVAVFTLLAVAIISSDHDVERLSAARGTSPRWSLREARKHLGRRLAKVAQNRLTVAVRMARAGIARLRRALEPERRQATRAALKKAWYDALVVMGMPPKALEAAPTSPSAPASGRDVSEHVSGGKAWLRDAFATRHRSAGRDMLQKARQAIDTAMAVPRDRGDILPTRRQRPRRWSRPPGSPGPSHTRRIRAPGSRPPTVGSLLGRPLGGDPKDS